LTTEEIVGTRKKARGGWRQKGILDCFLDLTSNQQPATLSLLHNSPHPFPRKNIFHQSTFLYNNNSIN
jgi:hypothetical protein